MTPEEFARVCKLTSDLREGSYNRPKDKYMLSYDNAAEIACARLKADPRWARIISVLIFPGYCDVWDWCDEVLEEDKT